MVAAVAWLLVNRNSGIPRNTGNRRHLKGGHTCADSKRFSVLQRYLRGWPWRRWRKRKSSIGIGIQPVCQYGYYDYAPYACTPYGFYGPGYFYNGIFLGMGPWAGWGYGHGWGGHRFSEGGGGSYRGGGGALANRSNYARGGAVHATPARVNATHATAASHGPSNAGGGRPSAASHAAASPSGGHAGGGESHGGGGGHK